jgi:hypothetical protein
MLYLEIYEQIINTDGRLVNSVVITEQIAGSDPGKIGPARVSL